MPYRVLSAEDLLCKRFVDDRHFGRSQIITIVEIAPGEKRGFHGLEISRSGAVKPAVQSRRGGAIRPGVLVPTGAANRSPADLRRRKRPGSSSQAFQDLAIDHRQPL